MVGLFEGLLVGVSIKPAPTQRPEAGSSGSLEVMTTTRGKADIMEVKIPVGDVLKYEPLKMTVVELLVDVAPWKLDNGKSGIGCTLVPESTK